MNSKIKILLLFCVQLSICSCFLDDYDDSEYYRKEPYYVNKSGVPVKIYIRWGREYLYSYSYGYMQDGDTLHRTFQVPEYRMPEFHEDTIAFYFPNNSWYTPSTDGNCGLTYDFDCKNPFFIRLQFLDESISCLVHSGPVQSSPTDMRSWKAYEKGDTILDVYSNERFVRYFYTITPEHKAMAKEEDCQSSTDE